MNFGIIGLGNIAPKIAKGINRTSKGVLYAVASTDKERADYFAYKGKAKVAYDSYDKLINDHKVEAVHIALPNHLHYEWATKALEQGKHVICEKPCGMNEEEVKKLTSLAKEKNVYFAEGFMYKVHPQTFKILEILKDDIIGEVKHINASLGFNYFSMENPPKRILKKELGGGAILNLGCDPLDFVRMLVSNILDKESEPTQFYSVGEVNEDGIDLHASAIMEFPSNITASISTAIDSQLKNDCKIYGTKGILSIKDPFTCSISKSSPCMSCELINGSDKKYYIDAKYLYSYEIEALMEYYDLKECQYLSYEDSINNAKWLDLWREQVLNKTES